MRAGYLCHTTLVLGLLLARARMSWEAHVFISWFGPRGLNSLLLALLVVLASVAIHGSSAAPISAWYGRKVARETLAEERESTAAGLLGYHEGEVHRITPEELTRLLAEPSPPVVLDVRSRSSYGRDGFQIPGSVRVLPDRITEWAVGRPTDRLVVAYCT